MVSQRHDAATDRVGDVDVDVDVDVAIVGAGISGLATAAAVVERRDTVIVFESRDRVGGRLASAPTAGGPVDLGATWFWPGEHRVAELVDRLGIAVHPHHLAGDALYQTDQGVHRIDGNPLDVPSGRFTSGAASLASALAATLPGGSIRLDEPVRGIAWSPTGVSVHHAGGTTTARHAVLALPPALASHRLTFTPSLPADLIGLATTTPVWMGAVAKVVARFEQPFWRDRGLAGSAISHTGPIRELHDMSGPEGHPAVLFGFVPLTPTTGPPNHEALRNQLVELFGPDAGRPLDLIVKNWRDEPDTSPPSADRLTSYATFGHRRFQEPFGHGRLHWASTETSPVAPGHIEGALAAAERAALAVVRALDRLSNKEPSP